MSSSEAGTRKKAAATPPRLVRAAQYLRMSTEAQAYSPKIQGTAIQAYAEAHGLELVKTYLDRGKSGLTLAGRPALRQLLSEVTGDEHGFEVLLVYDISRWGRFQDTDESAHYEFILRSAGLRLIYVAEQFSNDGSPFAAVFKSLKRAMAAEFSRELSNKVAAGHKIQAKRGFWQGARPGYALRRVLVTDDRGVKGRLKNGERKSLIGDRVLIEPGRKREIEAVRYIFDRYIEGDGTTAIAEELERLRYPRAGYKEWTYHQVNAILTNEKYAGTNVYGRTLQRLKRPSVPLPENEWIRVRDAFEPIISREKFRKAQERRANLRRNWSDEQYLDALEALWRRKGSLSREIIDADDEGPSSASYYWRFGNLTKAYQLIGYEPESLEGPLPQGDLRKKREAVLQRAYAFLRNAGVEVSLQWANHIELNGKLTMQVHVQRYVSTRRGGYWLFEVTSKHLPGYLVFTRLTAEGDQVLDHYIVPTGAPEFKRYLLFRQNNPDFERYRSSDLSTLIALASSAEEVL